MTAIALFVFAGGASAAGPQASAAEISEFSLPITHAKPGSIAEGPDGAMWFAVSTRYYTADASYLEWLIGRITLAGKVSYFKLPPNSAGSGVGAITAGPDGAMWYLTREAIGRITMSGQVTEFPHERVAGVFEDTRGAMTVGPDDNLWFLGSTPGLVPAAAMDRITASGEVTEIPFSTNDSYPQAIAWGPDADIWFASSFGGAIGHVSMAGKFTAYPVPGQPKDLVFGPGGVLWFTSEQGIGRISPAGELSPVVPFAGGGERIISGPDGRLWFSSGTEGVIGRIGPSGLTSQIKLRSSHRDVFDITVGPKGTVWYTAEDDTPCEGGGGTCLAFDASHKSGVIGRIVPALPKAVIRAAGSKVHVRRAELNVACMDGAATGACRGWIRLAIPNGPTLLRRRFQLQTDATTAIVLPVGRGARKAIRSRGNRRLVAVIEVRGRRTSGRSIAISG